jgi:hypothetical protein
LFLSDKRIKYAHALKAVSVLSYELQVLVGNLVPVVKLLTPEDDVESDVEVADINGPVELLNQRSGGEEDNAGMVFEKAIARSGKFLSCGVRIIVQRKKDIVGQHWFGRPLTFSKLFAPAASSEEKGCYGQGQKGFSHNNNLQ